MAIYTLGSLSAVPAADHPDLLGDPVRAALTALGLLGTVGVVEIDPELSDTAATEEAYGLDTQTLVNCVVVAGKREGIEKVAACAVPATTRADVNSTVKKRLDVRKASFLAREDAVERTGMEFGGISPIGLPADWPVLVDARVPDLPVICIGSGVRRSKLLLPGATLAGLPTATVIEGLGI
ncbi:YbaK/EbsC family protein [Tersicoccus sp. MR15.9]|uniref:YbaK/EbsC family protein n=1 Tax=Tersicoccus mangrovi TaxID=3121635 RepID=UPI002FE5A1CF